MKTKTILLSLLLVLIGLNTTNAQVGIGTTLTDETAILELKSTEKGFLPPRLTAEQRNNIENPAEGLVIYNLEQKCINFFDGNRWASFCSANGTGGDVVEDIEIDSVMYRVHQFTSTGTSSFTVTQAGDFDYLIVAGGGGGASHNAGGGGAGGVIFESAFLSEGNYTTLVGNGGQRDTNHQPGSTATNGGNSEFNGKIAVGGGRGGSWNEVPGANGGSGGGQGCHSSSPLAKGLGTGDQGNDGGNSINNDNDRGGGGGGGADEIGGNAISNTRGGNGGDGLYFGNMFGDNVGDDGWFGGGGGGAHRNAQETVSGLGGKGGGGNGRGRGDTQNAQSGIPNTGGGGGAKETDNQSGTGLAGNGGSGTIIIRYKIN